jgi:hypothetical protein
MLSVKWKETVFHVVLFHIPNGRAGRVVCLRSSADTRKICNMAEWDSAKLLRVFE